MYKAGLRQISYTTRLAHPPMPEGVALSSQTNRCCS